MNSFCISACLVAAHILNSYFYPRLAPNLVRELWYGSRQVVLMENVMLICTCNWLRLLFVLWLQSPLCALNQVGEFLLLSKACVVFSIPCHATWHRLPHLRSDCFRYDVCRIGITVVTLGKYRLLTEEHLEQELFSSCISSVSMYVPTAHATRNGRGIETDLYSSQHFAEVPQGRGTATYDAVVNVCGQVVTLC